MEMAAAVAAEPGPRVHRPFGTPSAFLNALMVAASRAL